jgi:esterase
MANDLLRFVERRELGKITLIGHNIGSKTAMVFAKMFPDRVAGLISLDTAPTASSPELKAKALQSLVQIKSIDIEGKTRKAAIDLINSKYADKGIANLITNNLAYSDANDHQTVKWTCNLDALINNIDSLTGFSYPKQTTAFTSPTFFLNGTVSVKYPDSVYLDEFP